MVINYRAYYKLMYIGLRKICGHHAIPCGEYSKILAWQISEFHFNTINR
jgi:hypothetical protein